MKSPHTDSVSAGIPMGFYPGRLADFDLYEIEYWARQCLRTNPKAPRLASYLSGIAMFELERREAEQVGEIVEVVMSPVPCHCWTNPEVVASLAKLDSIARATTGTMRELMERLRTVLIVEASERLDPADVAGIVKETK